jgi:hypothetical protein
MYLCNGKSSVMHELHKVVVPPRGLFASGKFDRYPEYQDCADRTAL